MLDISFKQFSISLFLACAILVSIFVGMIYHCRNSPISTAGYRNVYDRANVYEEVDTVIKQALKDNVITFKEYRNIYYKYEEMQQKQYMKLTKSALKDN